MRIRKAKMPTWLQMVTGIIKIFFKMAKIHISIYILLNNNTTLSKRDTEF